MDYVLYRDAQKLLEDSEKIKQDLGRLEQDRSLWAREAEKGELVSMMEVLKEVEIDVSMMTRDCVSAHQSSGNDGFRVIFHDLHQAFVYLDALFNDIKKTRSALQYAYIYPSLLERLEMNCGRFTKTVEHIRTDIDKKRM